MLFVINANNSVATGQWVMLNSELHGTCWVLDTDDLVVEQVTVSQLQDYIDDGIVVENVSNKDGRLFVNTYMCFMSLLNAHKMLEVNIFGGRLRYSNWLNINFNGTDLELKLKENLGNIILYMHDKALCSYDVDGRLLRSGVAYVYKCGAYFVFQIIILLQRSQLLTSVILDFYGGLIDIVPDRFAVSTSYVNSKDPAFSAKYEAVWGRRY